MTQKGDIAPSCWLWALPCVCEILLSKVKVQGRYSQNSKKRFLMISHQGQIFQGQSHYIKTASKARIYLLYIIEIVQVF